MISARLEQLRKNWVAALGWAIFIALLAALFSRHYIINPFIFGFSYYVGVILYRAVRSYESKDSKIPEQHLIFISIIALVNLWFAFLNESHRHAFIKKFEKTCYSSALSGTPQAVRLCEEIQSHIDNYLNPPQGDFEDDQ